MSILIRKLYGAKDFQEVVELQHEVGGMPFRDTMSPITLSALSLENPKVGWLQGAFDDDKMIGFCIAFATAEPGVVLGHMLGVLPRYQNSGAGFELLKFAFSEYREHGMGKVCTTYEPLESRNCNLYLNKLGGRAFSYLEDHYHLDTGLHHGMPQDRLLVEIDVNLDRSKSPPPALEDALGHYPVVTVAPYPDRETVLVEIPGDLRALQAEDEARAREWRLRTRPVFQEYINRRGLRASALLSDTVDQLRRSYLLLNKPD